MCGQGENIIIESTGNIMVVIFETDGSIHYPGFTADFRSVRHETPVPHLECGPYGKTLSMSLIQFSIRILRCCRGHKTILLTIPLQIIL